MSQKNKNRWFEPRNLFDTRGSHRFIDEYNWMKIRSFIPSKRYILNSLLYDVPTYLGILCVIKLIWLLLYYVIVWFYTF